MAFGFVVGVWWRINVLDIVVSKKASDFTKHVMIWFIGLGPGVVSLHILCTNDSRTMGLVADRIKSEVPKGV